MSKSDAERQILHEYHDRYPDALSYENWSDPQVSYDQHHQEFKLEKLLHQAHAAVEERRGIYTKTGEPVPLPSGPALPGISVLREGRRRFVENAAAVAPPPVPVLSADVLVEDVASCSVRRNTVHHARETLAAFFEARCAELEVKKYAHLMRWARFCDSTSVQERLRKPFDERLARIEQEHAESRERAARLRTRYAMPTDDDPEVRARRPAQHNRNVVEAADLRIYMRWSVCNTRSLQKFRRFAKKVQWLPYKSRYDLYVQAQELIARRVSVVTDPDNKPMAVASKGLPMMITDAEVLGAALDELRTYFGITASSAASDGQEFFYHVNKTFSHTHAAQAKAKYFPVYDVSRSYAKAHGQEEPKKSARPGLAVGSDGAVQHSNAGTRGGGGGGGKHGNQNDTEGGAEENAGEALDADVTAAREALDVTYLKVATWTSLPPIAASTVDQDAERLRTELQSINTVDEALRNESSFVDSDDIQVVTNRMRSLVETHRVRAAARPSAGFDDPSGGSANAAITSMLSHRDAQRFPALPPHKLLSHYYLQTLRTRDFKRRVLNTLNYFRSVERRLTIDAMGFATHVVHPSSSSSSGDQRGGTAPYPAHETPEDTMLGVDELMGLRGVHNRDDTYVIDPVTRDVRVRDSRGMFVMYDAAIDDFAALEAELLRVGTYYVQAHGEQCASGGSQGAAADAHAQASAAAVAAGLPPPPPESVNPDRLALLADLFESEMWFEDAKRRVVDCYLECYEHSTDPRERARLSRVIASVMRRRPRVDLSRGPPSSAGGVGTVGYFTESVAGEIVCMELEQRVLRELITAMVDNENAAVLAMYAKLGKGGTAGLPDAPLAVNSPMHKVVLVPGADPVGFADFHGTLAVLSRFPELVGRLLGDVYALHKPANNTERTALHRALLQQIIVEWRLMVEEDKLVMQVTADAESTHHVRDSILLDDPTAMELIANELFFEISRPDGTAAKDDDGAAKGYGGGDQLVSSASGGKGAAAGTGSGKHNSNSGGGGGLLDRANRILADAAANASSAAAADPSASASATTSGPAHIAAANAPSAALQVYLNALDTITQRAVLLDTLYETRVLTRVYVTQARAMGRDASRSNLTPLDFDEATAGDNPDEAVLTAAEMEELDEPVAHGAGGTVPGASGIHPSLALAEFERSLAEFDFQTFAGVKRVIAGGGLEELRCAAKVQVAHKNALVAVIQFNQITLDQYAAKYAREAAGQARSRAAVGDYSQLFITSLPDGGALAHGNLATGGLRIHSSLTGAGGRGIGSGGGGGIGGGGVENMTMSVRRTTDLKRIRHAEMAKMAKLFTSFNALRAPLRSSVLQDYSERSVRVLKTSRPDVVTRKLRELKFELASGYADTLARTCYPLMLKVQLHSTVRSIAALLDQVPRGSTPFVIGWDDGHHGHGGGGGGGNANGGNGNGNGNGNGDGDDDVDGAARAAAFDGMFGLDEDEGRYILTSDGKVQNIWYLPSHDDILRMFGSEDIPPETRQENLVRCLRITSALHDILVFIRLQARLEGGAALEVPTSVVQDASESAAGQTSLESVAHELQKLRAEVRNLDGASGRHPDVVIDYLNRRREMMHHRFALALHMLGEEFVARDNATAAEVVRRTGRLLADRTLSRSDPRALIDDAFLDHVPRYTGFEAKAQRARPGAMPSRPGSPSGGQHAGGDAGGSDAEDGHGHGHGHGSGGGGGGDHRGGRLSREEAHRRSTGTVPEVYRQSLIHLSGIPYVGCPIRCNYADWELFLLGLRRADLNVVVSELGHVDLSIEDLLAQNKVYRTGQPSRAVPIIVAFLVKSLSLRQVRDVFLAGHLLNISGGAGAAGNPDMNMNISGPGRLCPPWSTETPRGSVPGAVGFQHAVTGGESARGFVPSGAVRAMVSAAAQIDPPLPPHLTSAGLAQKGRQVYEEVIMARVMTINTARSADNDGSGGGGGGGGGGDGPNVNAGAPMSNSVRRARTETELRDAQLLVLRQDTDKLLLTAQHLEATRRLGIILAEMEARFRDDALSLTKVGRGDDAASAEDAMARTRLLTEFLQHLLSRSLETRTDEGRAAFVVTEAHLGAVLDSHARRLQSFGEGRIASRVHEVSLLNAHLAHQLYVREQNVRHLEHQLAVERRALLRRVQVEVADSSHGIVLEKESLARELAKVGRASAAASAEARESVRRDFEELVRDLTLQLVLTKSKFKEYRTQVYSDMLGNLSEVKKEALMKMVESGSAPLELKRKTWRIARMEDEQNRLKEENTELRKTILKLRTIHQMRDIATRSTYEKRLRKLQDESAGVHKDLWGGREETEKKEMLLRKELLNSNTQLTAANMELDQLRKDLELQNRNKAALVQWKVAKSQQLAELENKVKRYERWSSVDVDRLLAELGRKDNEIRHLSGLEARAARQAELNDEGRSREIKRLKQALAAERRLKERALAKLGAARSARGQPLDVFDDDPMGDNATDGGGGLGGGSVRTDVQSEMLREDLDAVTRENEIMRGVLMELGLNPPSVSRRGGSASSRGAGSSSRPSSQQHLSMTMPAKVPPIRGIPRPGSTGAGSGNQQARPPSTGGRRISNSASSSGAGGIKLPTPPSRR